MRSCWLVCVIGCATSSPPVAPLAKAPAIPQTCRQAADRIEALMMSGEHARKVGEVVERRCVDDRWPPEIRACMANARTLHGKHHCEGRFTASQHGALERELVMLELPAGCIEYTTITEKLADCSQMPRDAIDAAKASNAKMHDHWYELRDAPNESKSAFEHGCRQAAETLTQASTALCGW